MTKTLVAVTFAFAFAVAVPVPVRTARAQARMEQVMPINVDASSTLKGKKDTYAAWRAVDWDRVVVDGDIESQTVRFTTAWCEGKKDEGIGEWLELSGDNLSFSWLEIEAGYWKSWKLFQANNRPTKLTVIVTDHEGNQTSHDVEVPADMEAATLDLGKPTDVQRIRIQIAAVAKGKANDTCISNVTLVGDNIGSTHTLYLDTGASMQSLLTTITSINDALEQCDAAAFKTLIEFPMPYRPLPDLSDVGGKVAKTKFKSAAAMAKACKTAGAPSSSGEPDLMRLRIAGPGKYLYATRQMNDAGIVTWHVDYTSSPEDDRGTWRLMAVDYKRYIELL